MFCIRKEVLQAEFDAVESFLKRMKAILATKECVFARSAKNNDFDDEYPMKDAERIEVLRSLTIDDFVQIRPNPTLKPNVNYTETDCFVFVKNFDFPVYGEVEQITIYVKAYIREHPNREIVIVISFHKEGIFD